MKKLIIISILIITCFNSFAQTAQDTIQIKKRLGTVYLQNGKALTTRQLVAITQTNPEAQKEMKIAQTNYNIGSVFAFGGGALIGWPIGTALGGGDPNWTLAGVGVGVALISIPFSSAFSKHATKAVTLYNKGLKSTSFTAFDVKFGYTQNGIGLKVTF